MFKACDLEIDEEEAEDLMNEIDADGGGELEQDEFIEFLKREDERIEFSTEQVQLLSGVRVEIIPVCFLSHFVDL